MKKLMMLAASAACLSAFGTTWTLDSSTLTDGNWTLTVKNSNGNLTITKCTAGSGVFDLSGFDVPDCQVTAIGSQAFEGNTDVTSVNLPGVLVIEMRAFYNCSALTSATLSPQVTTLGDGAFARCSLTSFEPTEFPALTKAGAFFFVKSTSGNADLHLEISLPALEAIPGNFMRGGHKVTVFSAPVAKSIGASAFYETGVLEGSATDLEFPEVTSVGDTVFWGSGLTSIKLPKVKTFGTQALRNVTSLTNVVMGADVESFGGSVFSGDAALLDIQPFLPEREMTFGDANVFGGASKGPHSVTRPLVWNIPNQTEVMANLFYQYPLTNITFKSEVSSIGSLAFATLGPRCEVSFLGETVPTLGDLAFCRVNAESSNDRVRIFVKNRTALAGWRAKVAENAELYEAYKKDKPDWPGAKTIGLLTLSGTREYKALTEYAWVVDAVPEDGTGSLTIAGLPAALGVPDPNYGTLESVTVGTSTPCTAPESVEANGVRATLAGYAVTNVTSSGETVFVTDGEGGSYSHLQQAGSATLYWLWKDISYCISATAIGHGSVSAAETWAADGSPVELTATADAGYMFRRWEGDLGTADARAATIVLAADRVRAVRAVFTEPVTWLWTYDGAKIYNVSSDGEETNWVFGVDAAVRGGTTELTVNAYVAGEGPLDFSTFAVADTELTAIGKSLMEATARRSKIAGALNTGAVRIIGTSAFESNTGITSFALPSVTNIGGRAFFICSSATNAVLNPYVRFIGDSAFGGQDLLVLSPSEFPELEEIGGLLFYRNSGTASLSLVYSIVAPKLRRIGVGCFQARGGRPTLARFEAPLLENIPESAFYSQQQLGETDLTFENVTNIGKTAFYSSNLTSIRAPKVKVLKTFCFQNCASLTNCVFSDELKVIEPNAYSVQYTELVSFSPFLPKGMTAIDGTAFGGASSPKTLTEPLVWDNPAIPVVPTNLFYRTPLTNVTFVSEVTFVGRNVFTALGPKAEISFCGATVPTFDGLSFYRPNVEKQNDRIRIYVRNRAALDGWKALVAPNAELYESDYKKVKPDWPGRHTLGILKLEGTTGSGTVPTTYAWVVDGVDRGFSVLVK